MANGNKPAVIVVDDDEVYRTRLCRSFRLRSWETEEAGESGAALALAQQTRPDLAIVDLKMPGESGLEVIRRLRQIRRNRDDPDDYRLWQHRDGAGGG